MRTTFFLIIAFTVGTIAVQAQNVIVKSRISIAEKGFFPVLNTSGNKMLFTADGYAGLKMIDLQTKQITTISTVGGAGYEPVFAPDDSRIYFRETSFKNNLRYNSVESYDVTTKRSQQMLAPQRILNKIQPINNGVIAYVGNKMLRSSLTKNTTTAPLFVAANEDLQIVKHSNGKIEKLNPLNMPESRYIWVSLSPDNQKILFTAAGKGTFICDLKGKILSSLGSINAPVWFNNDYVVGMEDKDDGHRVVSSKIVMMSITKKTKTEISQSQQIAMYPTASGKSNRIAYHTETGEIEVITVKMK
ncbi:MAG: hypothetical protein Q7U47_10295 [Paludibacter sp.]|nr:hypothetical protein [Paludibacter sp.]